jgi:hypothetical protein
MHVHRRSRRLYCGLFIYSSAAVGINDKADTCLLVPGDILREREEMNRPMGVFV